MLLGGEWDEEGRGTAELDACKIRSQEMMVQSGALDADMMITVQTQIYTAATKTL